MVIIRLARHGTKKRPFYKIVAIDNRKARNGQPLAYLGFFDPIAKNEAQKLKLDLSAVQARIATGAQMTLKVCYLYKQAMQHAKQQDSHS
jgi:small subunit ribosomal protein S16